MTQSTEDTQGFQIGLNFPHQLKSTQRKKMEKMRDSNKNSEESISQILMTNLKIDKKLSKIPSQMEIVLQHSQS